MSDETTRTDDAPIKTPAGLFIHWCEHPRCERWGSLGYPDGRETRWFCGEHRPDRRDD